MSDEILSKGLTQEITIRTWRKAHARAEKAEAERDRLRAAVDAALALHVAGATNGGYRYCVTCESEEFAQPYPCPTRRALSTEETP